MQLSLVPSLSLSLRLGLVTKLYTLNPKAVTVVELYGILDPITRDWTDGLLSNIFRDVNKPTDKNERKYILFDGDVDALWVENMNSVMDDNKLLTLANGERIRLQKHCALLVEVRRSPRKPEASVKTPLYIMLRWTCRPIVCLVPEVCKYQC